MNSGSYSAPYIAPGIERQPDGVLILNLQGIVTLPLLKAGRAIAMAEASKAYVRRLIIDLRRTAFAITRPQWGEYLNLAVDHPLTTPTVFVLPSTAPLDMFEAYAYVTTQRAGLDREFSFSMDEALRWCQEELATF